MLIHQVRNLRLQQKEEDIDKNTYDYFISLIELKLRN